MTRVPEMTPLELADALERGDDLELLDVREPYEWSLGILPNARLVSLGYLPAAMSSLDATRDIVVYCRSGLRSADAVQRLCAAGFRATNLAGGILRWSDDVDPSTSEVLKPDGTGRDLARSSASRRGSSRQGLTSASSAAQSSLSRIRRHRPA